MRALLCFEEEKKKDEEPKSAGTLHNECSEKKTRCPAPLHKKEKKKKKKGA